MPQLLRERTRCSLVLAAASLPDAHGYFTPRDQRRVRRLADRAGPVLPRGQRRRCRARSASTRSTSRRWPAGASRPRRWSRCPPAAPDERDRRIAAAVVEHIPDRATLQVGIGGIPDAILASLTGHRDLGIHTELLSDGIIDLVERGVVTGTHKQLRRHKVVATFALGTQRLYDWMHDNGAVEMLPVDYVNDPRTIGRERDFVSINATTEVDLMGQCASETMAGRYWSSSGGQADFARGAMYSEGGKAFIVLRSTTSQGRSRIRASLTEGSVVTTLKNTVDHVVDGVGGGAPARPLAGRPRAGADRDRAPGPSRGARAGGAGAQAAERLSGDARRARRAAKPSRAPRGTTSTGQCALRRTPAETLPSITLPTGPWPRGAADQEVDLAGELCELVVGVAVDHLAGDLDRRGDAVDRAAACCAASSSRARRLELGGAPAEGQRRR